MPREGKAPDLRDEQPSSVGPAEESTADAEHAEARFRAICECAPLGIFVTEVDRGTIYVNPAMERILGWKAEELLGANWRQAVHPGDLQAVLGTRGKAYQAGAGYDEAVRYIRKDGKVVWTHLHAAPMRRGGTVFGYVGTLEDITETKKLQAELAVSERMASLGTLAAGVAHEVNTPLAAALGNLDWVTARLHALIEQHSAGGAEESDEADAGSLVERLGELQEPLEDARDAAGRVRVIMQDLKLFSRPEEERQRAVDLARVLDSAARLAWPELRHRARLVRDQEPEQLPAVYGSEARLGQVFLNLLINAAQAIPEGRVEDHSVRLSVRLEHAGEVIVEVSDTGTGIAPEVIEHIFDPFFTTKPQGIGTGLGLAICHRIVRGLDGQIEVESQLGKGSTFRVKLRAAAVAPSVELPAPREAVPSGRRGRVLVIDDDESMTNVVKLIVGEHHEVVAASGARPALERLLAGERYDVILCDLMMPEMTGMDFHAELSAALPELAERIVFLTGGAFTARARDFIAQVSNARIDKPFEVQELLALLHDRMG